MLRGLYTAASGMISEQRKHDILTNNIGNLNTPGFKQGNAVSRSFPEMLISRIRGGPEEAGRSVTVGRIHTGVLAEENVSLHAQGDLQETLNPFDFALVSDIQVPGAAFDASGKYVDENGQRVFQPQALFTVLNGNNERRYSLNGKFTVNALGELVNGDGLQVLGRDGQPIRLVRVVNGQEIPIHDFKVTAAGEFLDENGQPLNNAAGQRVALLLSRADNPNLLVREGNGLYYVREEDAGTVTGLQPGDQVTVRQGFIERSNVAPEQAMVDIMAALRAYEANQKVIQFYDKSMEKAVNEIGRV
ncbi:flagellar hook-basal body protein [Paenibacillus chartarius]|uniref:Flagellar hook-basal body protein n=1 Tax=Paenibacillus chartarius TaxID=747481 RepID=A0ABV6DJV2_9BACL